MRHPRCERADDEHADRENGDDGLRSRVKQPIDTFRQLMRVGDEPVEESDRQDRQEPQQGDGARDCSPPPERLINLLGPPPAQPPGSEGGGNSEPEHEQSGFENEERHIVLIAKTAPPVGHDVANAGCGQWNIVRHTRPGLRRVNARERLQQARREILSTDVLDGIDELVDAQIGGVRSPSDLRSTPRGNRFGRPDSVRRRPARVVDRRPGPVRAGLIGPWRPQVQVQVACQSFQSRCERAGACHGSRLVRNSSTAAFAGRSPGVKAPVASP